MDETISEWKYPLWKQQTIQIIRIFRPKEVHRLIDNITIKDEPSWAKGRETQTLRDAGFTDRDIQNWIKFYLYSGVRFSEGIFIHNYRDGNGKTLYQNNGTLWMPRHKSKGKLSIVTRTIFFSYKGREIIDDFFKSPQIPADNQDQIAMTLTSLSQMMHKAGKRINLPETTLTVSKKITLKDSDGNPIKEMVPSKKDFMRNPDGTYSQVMKERIKTKTVEQSVTTNGCAFRSLRKTWESWLTASISTLGNDPLMRDRILNSQGHTLNVALKHYLEITFDKEDLEDISKEIEGFGVLE